MSWYQSTSLIHRQGLTSTLPLLPLLGSLSTTLRFFFSLLPRELLSHAIFLCATFFRARFLTARLSSATRRPPHRAIFFCACPLTACNPAISSPRDILLRAIFFHTCPLSARDPAISSPRAILLLVIFFSARPLSACDPATSSPRVLLPLLLGSSVCDLLPSLWLQSALPLPRGRSATPSLLARPASPCPVVPLRCAPARFDGCCFITVGCYVVFCPVR